MTDPARRGSRSGMGVELAQPDEAEVEADAPSSPW